MPGLSSMSSSPKTSNQAPQKNKKGWLQWDKNKVLWFYLTALSMLLIYGLFNADAAIKLIDALVKAMEFVINGI